MNGEDITASQLANKINVWDAIQMIKTAWDLLSPSTIKGCFRKAGFLVMENAVEP